MKINILYGIDGAKQAQGAAVIIDVFRAASTAAYLLNKGIQYIIPVATKEEAFSLKKQNPEFVLVGEEDGYKIEGFDLGNSPFQVNETDLKDKIAVLRTSQGTQGIVNATQAQDILFGSFPNTQAIVNYIMKNKFDVVSLVAMGGIGSAENGGKGGEDDQFALFLKNRLEGQNPSVDSIIKYLQTHEGAQRFLDPNIPEFPSEDFSLCLATDIFDFVARVQKENDLLKIVKG